MYWTHLRLCLGFPIISPIFTESLPLAACLAFRVPSTAFELRSNTSYYKQLPKEPGNPRWKYRDSSWTGGRQFVYFLPIPADSKEDIAYSWWEISYTWAAMSSWFTGRYWVCLHTFLSCFRFPQSSFSRTIPEIRPPVSLFFKFTFLGNLKLTQ